MTLPDHLLASDPVDQFDRRWHDRSYHREVVRAALRDVPWKGGETIGELLSDRCRSSRLGHRCERKSGHLGQAHLADNGGLEWGGA